MELEPFLLTFSTYGSWLHGDARGSWNRSKNLFGARPALEAWEMARLRHPPISITPEARSAIQQAFSEACSRRGWKLHAANVRMQHIHVVVGLDGPGDRAIGALKAYATRHLRSAGLIGPETTYWSRGGDSKHLPTDAAFERALDYVLYRQGVRLPAVPGGQHSVSGRPPRS